MKFLLGLTLCLMAQMASADYCSATLKDRFGSPLRSFSEYGYTHQEACRDALRSCSYEKERLQYDRYYEGLYCELDTFRNPVPSPYPTPYPGPGRDRNECEVELQRANGNVITTFRARSYDRRQACMEARRDCEVELRANQRQGRMPRAMCVEVQDRRDRDLITRTCSVEQVDTRMGRVVDTHRGVATGRQNEDVQRRACDEAVNQCMAAVRQSRRPDTCVMARNQDRFDIDIVDDRSGDSFDFGYRN